jgi:thymidylate kinase
MNGYGRRRAAQTGRDDREDRDDRDSRADADFWTLVGPDFAGKSTLLGRLHDDHGWHVISYDDRYLDGHPLIRELRRQWVDDAFAWTGRRYSAELVLSVLHPIVLHLRDELARAAGRERVIVDSYYYKLLAKCRLLGVDHPPLFDYWRSFPQPRGVLYLDLPPEEGWLRSRRGAALNAFEHHGALAEHTGFVRLQSELRTAVLAEVEGLPVTVVDATASPASVLAQALACLGMAVAQ